MDSKQKKWPIVLAVTAGILCLCVLAVYLVFHHYVGLMKRPAQGDTVVIQETIEPETEETVAGTDTDEEDIRALDCLLYTSFGTAGGSEIHDGKSRGHRSD